MGHSFEMFQLQQGENHVVPISIMPPQYPSDAESSHRNRGKPRVLVPHAGGAVLHAASEIPSYLML